MIDDPLIGDPLAAFSAPVRAWFSAAFAEATPSQAQGWSRIADGEHTLICAPTGTGKTLAAFLWAIDRLMTRSGSAVGGGRSAVGGGRSAVGGGRSGDSRRLAGGGGTRVLYVSPLRALAVDVEKNLRSPLRGIRFAAERLGVVVHEPTVGVRTGDTSAGERRRLVRCPPDILITTPESLFLMLTSRARETLCDLQYVIVDEIHAVAGSKRGAHLMISIERLEELCDRPPQRIALSATQRPLEEIARFLGGFERASDGSLRARSVAVVDIGATKQLDVEVVAADLSGVAADLSGMAPMEQRSVWPSIHLRLLDLVDLHRSTLIFANARRLCERLAASLNELHSERQSTHGRGGGSAGTDAGFNELHSERQSTYGRGGGSAGTNAGFDELHSERQSTQSELVKAHHGSMSRERRLLVEDELKRGGLRGLVATSTLELGIDMGAVDLVVQVGSPGSVASGLQRVGRAGHQVGEPSRGKVFPKHCSDLLESAAVVERMCLGLVERTHYLRNPLDVLAQQIVAMCAMDDWPVERLAGVLRRCAGFADLTDDVLHSVLGMLSGAYPAEEFSELRPRISWDRAADVLRGRAGAQRLAVVNAGTIPDRGLFGVFLPDGTRVGELDEEMVHESRTGQTFLLGASSWRIVDITFDRVVVSPAPGEPARMPFWHGDGPGRPIEVGRAMGGLVRELRSVPDPAARVDMVRNRCGLDSAAADSLVAYLDEQAAATGAVPDDRTVVVERFRDEIGDWRVCVLTPFGVRVHAPWGIALQSRLGEMWGVDVDLMWSDDGIVMRLPEAVDEVVLDDLVFDPEDVRALVVECLPGTSMFASRFRECAARALLLPRRRPGQRTPLWQQRQRSADLLRTAARYPSFPVLLETARECAEDVFDLTSLVEVMSGLRSRRIRMVAADTREASPFARSLLFSWIAVHMYEGDAPLAERRATALALDRGLLRDLLGEEDLRELLDPEVLAEVELELQRLVGRGRARDADEAHDLLRVLGPLSLLEISERSMGGGVSAAGGAGVSGTVAADSAAGGAGVSGTVAADSAAGDDTTAVPDAVVAGWVRRLVAERRAVEVRLAGRDVLVDIADAIRFRDVAGVALPPGLSSETVEPVDDPLGDLCVRYARTHGPFTAADVADWLGVGGLRVAVRLAGLVSDGRLLQGEFRPGGTGREFCDPGVLRRIRRRCLAALRNEVEPVEPEALARFLPVWQGVGSRRCGVDAVAEAVGRLQGAPVSASVLEADVLSARVSGYRPDQLDELCAAGEVVWVGDGAIGASDGRVRLVFRQQAALLLSHPGAAVDGAVHDALRQRLDDWGASFWGDLVAAAQAAGLPYDTPTVLAALWDLVWNGEVTNDTLAPLRAWTAARGRVMRPRSASRAAWGAGGSRGRRVGSVVGSRMRYGRPGYHRRTRPRLSGLSAAGPPAAAGRWSLVGPLLHPEPSAAEAALAQAHQLLDRYGIVTRETALGEGYKGGFAGVYPVLKMLAERGEVNRGYFVAGLGAAQFALPGAVDRLRATHASEPDESAAVVPTVGAEAATTAAPDNPTVLAATDPAQLYGAALDWPESPGRPSRTVGAHVVLVGGKPLVLLGRGGRSLITFAGADTAVDVWASAIIGLVASDRLSKLEIVKVDGVPVQDTPWASRLEEAGFTPGYRGLVYRCA